MEPTSLHITADDQQNKNRFRWLTTFNDLMTLLLVFFVFLYSMSNPDALQFKNFQNSLQSAMGVLFHGQNSDAGTISEEQKPSPQPAQSPVPEQPGGDSLNQLENTQGLEAEYTQRGIQLTLNDNLLFQSGQARLTAGGTRLLDRVAKIIGPLGRHIRVEGHTDDVPISTPRYPSNWELSAARAVNVVKYMQQRGSIPPQRLSAAGYGASKPRVLNNADSNRSKNRRVEIILQEPEPAPPHSEK